VGGQFALASTLRGYPEYGKILRWYESELDRLSVPIDLLTDVDDQWLRNADPYAVIIATGSGGITPAIPGAELDHVCDVRDWLASSRALRGDSVIIWGGDREALAVGDHLAADGVKVIFVFGGAVLGRDVGRFAKPYVLRRLSSNPSVTMIPLTRIVEVRADGVLLASETGESWLPHSGDLLVSQGAAAVADLLASVRQFGLPGGAHAVGDAAGRGGSIADVVWDAAQLATMLTGFPLTPLRVLKSDI
jgi:hypothetical protein